MKNMKKTLVMCICLVLIAVMAIGGTVAYLTVDPIEKGNVFSVGNIAINLTEDVGTTGAATVTSDNNGATYENVMPGDYLKKEVTVENTGSRPAYVAVEVTINNALEINNAIDEFYEAKGYSEAEIQQIYDYIFEGFGMNYTKKDANGNATGMRLTITDDKMPENVLQVDSVKTISEYWLQYSGNWFMDTDTVIPYDGYYTTGMNDYELRYTYYLLLEAGEKSTLFKGFKVPKEFNAQQLDMFNGLNIDIIASAIQKDNFDDAKTAFSTLKNEMVWVVKDAASLAKALKKGGKIKLADNITNTGDAFMVPAGVNVELDLNGKDIITEVAYDSTKATASSAFVNNGTVILSGNGTIKATNNYSVRNYGEMVINGITVENGIMNFADLTVNSGNISNSRSGKHTIYGNAAKLTLNGGTFYNGNAGNAGIFAYGGEVVINGGEYSIADGTATLGWTSCLIDAQGGAKYTINGGVINGEGRDYGNNTTIYGGTFSIKPKAQFIASGYKLVDNANGTWSVEMPKAANATDLKNEIANGSSLIAVEGKITAEDLQSVTFNQDTTIVGGTFSRDTASGNPLTVKSTDTVTFEDVKFESVKGSAVLATRTNGANLVLNDCVFNNLAAPSTGNVGIQVYAENVTMVFNNCTFNNMPVVTNSSYPNGIKLVFNNCTFNWTGANCPGMIQLANYVVADIDFNGCKCVYDALASKSAKNLVATYTSVGAGTTIDFNDFEMIGKGTVCKAWSIVGKGGVTTGNNVTVTASGSKSYTFNGAAVDFDTYLFR